MGAALSVPHSSVNGRVGLVALVLGLGPEHHTLGLDYDDRHRFPYVIPSWLLYRFSRSRDLRNSA